MGVGRSTSSRTDSSVSFIRFLLDSFESRDADFLDLFASSDHLQSVSFLLSSVCFALSLTLFLLLVSQTIHQLEPRSPRGNRDAGWNPRPPSHDRRSHRLETSHHSVPSLPPSLSFLYSTLLVYALRLFPFFFVLNVLSSLPLSFPRPLSRNLLPPLSLSRTLSPQSCTPLSVFFLFSVFPFSFSLFSNLVGPLYSLSFSFFDRSSLFFVACFSLSLRLLLGVVFRSVLSFNTHKRRGIKIQLKPFFTHCRISKEERERADSRGKEIQGDFASFEQTSMILPRLLLPFNLLTLANATRRTFATMAEATDLNVLGGSLAKCSTRPQDPVSG